MLCISFQLMHFDTFVAVAPQGFLVAILYCFFNKEVYIFAILYSVIFLMYTLMYLIKIK